MCWASFPLSGDLILNNGWIVRRGFGHLEHAYCDTSFAGQTKAADHVFVAQSRESLRPSSRQQFYSDISRAREQVHIFTDDANALREKLEKDATQLTASDLKQRQMMAAFERQLASAKEKKHERRTRTINRC